MSDQIITLIIAVISSGLLGTVVTWFLSRIDKNDGIREGLRMLLERDINADGTEFIVRGYIYDDELERIIRMHSCYHDTLKGNGHCDAIMNKVKQLPMKIK